MQLPAGPLGTFAFETQPSCCEETQPDTGGGPWPIAPDELPAGQAHGRNSHVSELSWKRIFPTSWAADVLWNRDKPTLPNSSQIVNL